MEPPVFLAKSLNHPYHKFFIESSFQAGQFRGLPGRPIFMEQLPVFRMFPSPSRIETFGARKRFPHFPFYAVATHGMMPLSPPPPPPWRLLVAGSRYQSVPVQPAAWQRAENLVLCDGQLNSQAELTCLGKSTAEKESFKSTHSRMSFATLHTCSEILVFVLI